LFPEARAELMTVLAVASTALSAIRRFSTLSDGGLSAMLRAQYLQMQVVQSQLNVVIEQLGDIKANLAGFPDEMRKANEVQTLTEYYDEIISLGRLFGSTFTAEEKTAATERASFTSDYRNIANAMAVAAGKMQSYASLIPAVAVPIALAVEIAVRTRGQQENFVVERLDRYEDWLENIVDSNHVGSVGKRPARPSVI
jgi:hypothetical protein